jgi:RNA polymerase-binding transcription factor DksA
MARKLRDQQRTDAGRIPNAGTAKLDGDTSCARSSGGTSVTAALERIHDGTYGTCADCGDPIERARLDAMPEASACLRC